MASCLTLTLFPDRSFQIRHNCEGNYFVDPYVLSSASVYFREAFLTDGVRELDVRDRMEEAVFAKFIELLHFTKTEIRLRDALQILHLGELWKVQSIVTKLKDWLKTLPEAELRIASIMDDYLVSRRLPPAGKYAVEELEELFSYDSMHRVDTFVLMNLLMLAQQKGVDPEVLNEFIVDHIRVIPEDAAEIAQYLDAPRLSTVQLDFLCRHMYTFNLKKIQMERDRRHRAINLSPTKWDDEQQGPFLRVTPPFYGVFAALGLSCKGDPVMKGKVRISASSNDPQCFIDPSLSKFTVDGKDAFIQISLPYSFPLTGYEIQGLSKWSLLGSEGGKEWIEIDHAEDISEPKCRRNVRIEGNITIFKVKDAAGIQQIEFFSEEFPDGVCQALKQMIVVTTSNNHLHRMASPRHKGMWYSANEEGQWIQFELTDCSIVPELYTIKCGKFWLLKSWELLGSADGRDWEVLDRRTDIAEFCEPYAHGSWDLMTALECRYFRIRQTGETRDGLHVLCLSGVEIFGVRRKLKQKVVAAVTKVVFEEVKGGENEEVAVKEHAVDDEELVKEGDEVKEVSGGDTAVDDMEDISPAPE
jgi:hypothetical protein